jgi:hypothetical protein
MAPFSESVWNSIKHSSLGVHFWNKVTSEADVVPGSFFHFLLERFAISSYSK